MKHEFLYFVSARTQTATKKEAAATEKAVRAALKALAVDNVKIVVKRG